VHVCHGGRRFADVVVIGQRGHAADAFRRALRVPVLFVSASR
jgi:hypothetical protein